jgi:NAD(P)-dependent dehydrogenase (short-subunit alcohol dehydrogenase family)
MAERVACLGTGIMGTPMARSLLEAGFRVRVWNRAPEKARVLAADGADLAETPADAVREAAFVITMLTDTAAVLAVVEQAAASVPDGAVWLQTSMDTDAERAARLAEDHGISVVNCPVIGTGRRPSGAGSSCSHPDPPTPRPGTADLRRDRVEDRQARARDRPSEPLEARGDRLDRGARGEPPRPAEPRPVAIADIPR